MVFRSLLFCALVSYVVVIAASPIEDKKVGVAQDSNLTDLEDISIESEVINDDSEERSESEGFVGGKLFKKVVGKAKEFSGRISSASHDMLKKVSELPARAKGGARRFLNKFKGGRRGETPRTHRSHSKDRKFGAHKKYRTSERNNSRDNRRVNNNGRDYGRAYNNSRGYSDHRRPFPGSGMRTQRNTTDRHHNFFEQIGQGISSAATALNGEGVSTFFTSINQLAENFLPKSKPTPRKHRKNHDSEDDYYRDDDNNGDISDYEDGDDSCKELAIQYCFEEFESSDSEKCMDEYIEYMCSRN